MLWNIISFIIDPLAGEACEAFTWDMCKNPLLKTIALMRCPQKCGLCDQQGAAGMCINALGDEVCNALRAVICTDDKTKNSCQKTCGIKTCLGKFARFLSCSIED